MKKTATVEKVFRKDKVKNGRAAIHIRITKFRVIRYLPTGISVGVDEWDNAARSITKVHRQFKMLNNMINQMFLEVEDFCLDLERTDPQITSPELKEAYLAYQERKENGIDEENVAETPLPSFLSYLIDHIAHLEELEKWGTLKKAKNVHSKLRTYLKKKLKKDDLLFLELDHLFLGKYEKYLRKELGNSSNTIYKEMSLIRALFNDAIDDDIMAVEQNQYPFRKYKLKWEKTRKKKLRDDNIHALEELSLESGSRDWHIRNLYLFSIHSGGMRISDLLTFQVKHFDGTHVSKLMFKTETRLNFLVTPVGKEILSFYLSPTSHPEDFIFPFLKNNKDYSDSLTLYKAVWAKTAYINKRLKMMGKKAEITLSNTSHVGRGTFISRSVRKGMGLDFAQGIVGHNSRKTTEGYLELDQQDYDEAIIRIYGH